MLGISLFPLVIGALGWLGLACLWPKQEGAASVKLLRFSLGLGLGFALLSFLMFFWLLAVGRWTPRFDWAVVIALFGLAALAWRRRSRPSAGVELFARPKPENRDIEQILGFYFSVALAFAVVISAIYFLCNPHGNWDAWSHWNLRARFIFRGDERWADALHPDYWNPLNYPLMWPMSVAAGWVMAGKETQFVPGIAAFLFAGACVLLLQSSLSRLRGRSQGLLAGLLLVGTPFFLTHGNSQYSDIPLAFFFLATFACVALYDFEEGKAPGYLVIAGFMAGFAGWTKNEGQLFVICYCLLRFGTRLLTRGFRVTLREALLFSAGLLPVTLVILYVKTQLYPAATILQTRGVPYNTSKFSDLTRYRKIIRAYARTSLHFGQWWLSLPILLGVYTLWVRFTKAVQVRREAYEVLAVLVLMLAGYFLVYLSTPHDLDWLLGTSVDRLFLCLWPSFLFGFFLLLRTPEEVLAPASAKQTFLAPGEMARDACI